MSKKAMIWTGRVLTGLFALFMLGASIAPKLLGLPVAEETMTALGWPDGYVLMIGLIELTCLVLYLIPQTSVFGAVRFGRLSQRAQACRGRTRRPGVPNELEAKGRWTGVRLPGRRGASRASTAARMRPRRGKG